MEYCSNNYNPDTIIFCSKRLAFGKIPRGKLIDFLPRLYNNKTDTPILNTWKKHFMGLGIPFAITRQMRNYGGVKTVFYTLWKERRV